MYSVIKPNRMAATKRYLLAKKYWHLQSGFYVVLVNRRFALIQIDAAGGHRLKRNTLAQFIKPNDGHFRKSVYTAHWPYSPLMIIIITNILSDAFVYISFFLNEFICVYIWLLFVSCNFVCGLLVLLALLMAHKQIYIANEFMSLL